VDSFITGRRENLAPFLSRIELLEGDLRDRAVCAQAVKGVQIVLHQAALGSVPRSIADPLTTHDSNLTATLNLLLAARDAGVSRLVVASSSSIYGANPALPKTEDLAAWPLSPYAVTKLGQEQYCLAFSASYGLATVALRYFNIYGPRQDPNSQYAAVIPRFIRAALDASPPTIYGDGAQTRDFTFVGDCVAANLLAAEAPEAVGRAFNVCGGGETSILELWSRVKEITGTKAVPVHAAARQGEVKRSRGDISLAGKILGWRPATPLPAGLAKTVEWMKGQSVNS